MSMTIYHNPRCSKSRKTLELIQEAGVIPNIVDYLSEPPSAARILQLADLLGSSVVELLRRKEADFRNATDLPALDNNAALAAWVEAHPQVLERPIVVDDDANKAIMGRPPENVQALLPG